MSFISVFDVMGPNMIGPSSSHTAGALRIAFIAGKMVEKPVSVPEDDHAAPEKSGIHPLWFLRQNIQGTRYRPCPPWRDHGLFHR